MPPARSVARLDHQIVAHPRLVELDRGADSAEPGARLEGPAEAVDGAFEVALLMRNRFMMYEVYEEWFEAYKLSPVLVLATDKLDYLTNLVDRVDLFRQIEKHL